ncbi:MAG TPA: ABC transporter permease subunit [Stellaceae bacterium]|nr:ABC transporter permease subunit [Stellaceae bacterium]
MERRPSRGAVIGQWVVLALLVAAASALFLLAHQNFARRHVSFDFGFLAWPANFDIPFHLISWSESDSYGRVILVALLNTLLVSALAIVTGSILGLLIGIMRLSRNWLVRNLSLAYIEVIRNTPQLVQIVFIYVATVQLPPPRQSIALGAGALLSNRGLYLPAFIVDEGMGWLPWLALALLAAIPFLWRRKLARRPIGGYALLLVPVAIGLGFTAVERLDFPALKGFNIVGGVVVPPELVALWLGLSLYGAAFIGEIVRGAIEAVPKGQNEAAQSLGLSYAPRLFLVTLPQALRIMVPPLTSQYLNIIKTSSLGAFIAFPELFQMILGTVMQHSDRYVETLFIVGMIFLAINLVTSAFMNWYNRRAALVER